MSTTIEKTKNITFEEFQELNTICRIDIKDAMYELSSKLQNQAIKSDQIRKSQEKIHYQEFIACVNSENNNAIDKYAVDFNSSLSYSENINMLDILEIIVNTVYIESLNNNKMDELNIPEEVLKIALNNTVKMVSDSISSTIEQRKNENL